MRAEPVALTLPLEVIHTSRAVVRLAQPELKRRAHPPAELVTFGISFEQGMTIASLELRIADALEDRTLTAVDRELFQAIATILKTARRSESGALLQRSIIVLQGQPAARRSRDPDR